MKNIINANKFFPVLITKKLEETKQFYTSLLGCAVVFDSDWYVQLVSPKGIEIALFIEGHSAMPDHLPHQAFEGNGIVFTFDVENVDEEYKKVTETSIKVVYEIKSEDWGQRHFMIQDPNGTVIDIVQEPEQ
ncbi:MAG: VOC family protein [Terriglobales bacterium]